MVRSLADRLAPYRVTRRPARLPTRTGLPMPVIDLREPPMPDNGEHREPTIGERLGLGHHWQPAPASWEWVRLPRVGADPLHVLKLHTVGGVTGVVFEGEALRRLLAQGQEQLSGLHVPTGVFTREAQ